MKNTMKRAHEIRKAAATKWNCKVSEIIFSECLKMAWTETEGERKMKEWTVNGSGFVNMDSRDWGYVGDKGTWAKLVDGKATVKRAAKGTVSSAYEAEMAEFCENHGIGWDKVGCGETARS